jgi:hypothetical protein
MQPYHLPDRQQYAVAQERQRHTQALYGYGEYAMFCLLWNREDYDNGLVGSCLRCVIPRGVVADVYQQASDSKCLECFGTGYEGGYKAKIVRPSLWDYTEESYDNAARGNVKTHSASVQTTADFKMRSGDYIFRGDLSRWQMRTQATNHLRTGFDPVDPHGGDALGYNFGTVVREDPDSIIYSVPPTPAALAALLDVEHAHYPLNFTAVEEIRAPLL